MEFVFETLWITAKTPVQKAICWVTERASIGKGIIAHMTRLFGTDGVRGLANEALTASLALKLGAAAATVLGPQIPADARRATLAGAGLFLLSDSILGLRKFVLADPPAWMEGAVMATYTGAQYLIADGAARAGGVDRQVRAGS